MAFVNKVEILISHPRYYLLRQIPTPAEEILKELNRPGLKIEDGIPDVVAEMGGTVHSGSVQMWD